MGIWKTRESPLDYKKEIQQPILKEISPGSLEGTDTKAETQYFGFYLYEEVDCGKDSDAGRVGSRRKGNDRG